ncbi:MAG: heavy metal translocating P-type ATPase, partial [Actinomycetota bacterium]
MTSTRRADGASQAESRIDIAVEGMTCGACAVRIQDRLGSLDGVVEAQVNFANGRATVRRLSSVTDGDLTTAIESLGYGVIDEGERDVVDAERQRNLGRRLLVAALLTVPAVAISMIPPLRVAGWEWVVGALATPVVFWSGWPFHRAAVLHLRHRSTTMDTLVSMGSSAAWLWSAVVLVAGIDGGHIYFETAAVIVTLILAGKYLEAQATRRSGDAIRALAELGANTATLVDGTEIPADHVTVGMRFVVKPGERIVTDGRVVDGFSAIDASMVTGEPVPVEVGVGEEVIGATINTNGSLIVEATRVGTDTALAQIIALVDEAQGSRAEIQRLADRVSSVFVPVAIAIAFATLAAWLALGRDLDDAFTAAVAVLIIACPCALGLATPLGIMVGTGRGAQLGVIIKGGEILEDTRAVDAIVLDKTGTITEGRMAVAEVVAPEGNAAALRRLAAAVEARSEHPIAQAIVAGHDDLPPVTGFASMPGAGVMGVVEGAEIRVGQRRLFAEIHPDVEAAAAAGEAAGSTAVLVGRNGQAEAAIVVTDQIKATSGDAIRAFQQQGLAVTLLTGDNTQTAETVGAAVGVDRVIAETRPSDKAEEIRRLQGEGRRVAMVGDGINDAPALAQADLGIAIGTGTDVAIEASDLTVVSGDLLAVADAIELARRTLSTIKGNLFWAFAYNTAAIPLAALGVLNPMIAAGAMGLSSLFVVTNSLRLRGFAG